MTNRDFPKNTCPASRHVEMMAEILATGARYYMFEDEPEHCAESMRAVVEELWRLRTLAAQQGAREAQLRAALEEIKHQALAYVSDDDAVEWCHSIHELAERALGDAEQAGNGEGA